MKPRPEYSGRGFFGLVGGRLVKKRKGADTVNVV